MTAPEPKFDAELAWDLQEWSGNEELSRDEIKQLATFLTAKGYSKGKSGTGLGGLLSSLEDAGAKLVDEFGPIIDGLRKPK